MRVGHGFVQLITDRYPVNPFTERRIIVSTDKALEFSFVLAQ